MRAVLADGRSSRGTCSSQPTEFVVSRGSSTRRLPTPGMFGYDIGASPGAPDRDDLTRRPGICVRAPVVLRRAPTAHRSAPRRGSPTCSRPENSADDEGPRPTTRLACRPGSRAWSRSHGGAGIRPRVRRSASSWRVTASTVHGDVVARRTRAHARRRARGRGCGDGAGICCGLCSRGRWRLGWRRGAGLRGFLLAPAGRGDREGGRSQAAAARLRRVPLETMLSPPFRRVSPPARR